MKQEEMEFKKGEEIGEDSLMTIIWDGLGESSKTIHKEQEDFFPRIATQNVKIIIKNWRKPKDTRRRG